MSDVTGWRHTKEAVLVAGRVAKPDTSATKRSPYVADVLG